jgi:hypothetical protein
MTAAKYDLEIDQGSSFSTAVTVRESGNPKNLNGFGARASMRPSIDSPDSQKTDFTFDLTSASSGVVIMKLSHTVSSALTAGVYFYDLEIFEGDAGSETSVTRLMQGKVTINPEVTR